jgi:RNA polymerase sigma-70 factor (ECF subfamily)
MARLANSGDRSTDGGVEPVEEVEMTGAVGTATAGGAIAAPPRRDAAESRIAELLRNSDDEGLRLITDRYGPALQGFLSQLLGDRAGAEDVYQRVLLEAWQRRREYDPRRASVFSWLLMMARSRAIDAMRRRVPRPLDPSELPDPPQADSQIDRLLERWRVVGLLAQLPRQEAELLHQRFYLELSQREIAERTGISLGTVKTRMVRGLERLRRLLEREEPQ